MKRIHILIVLFFIVPVCLGAQVVDRIAAIVNGEMICLSELEKLSALIAREVEKSNPGMNEAERTKVVQEKVLDQLISQKLLDQEAKRLKIEVSKKEIEQAIEEVQKRNAFSRRELVAILKNEGFTMETYREQIARDMKKGRLIEYEIRSKINITDDEIKEYYVKNMAKPDIKEGIRIQQIFLAVPPESGEEKIHELQNLAKNILESLQKGGDFGTLAQQYSQDLSAPAGGDLGFFQKGELLPALEEAAYRLKDGEVGPLIKSQLGFHIIKVLEKREGDVKLDGWIKSRDQIKGVLYQKESERMFEQWLKNLKEKSFIEVRL
jgi:peptidyl-prolyl cis-trans isomerase SurA